MIKCSSTEVTGWILTDAIIISDCPKCKSTKGYYCQTPSGKKSKSTHTERIEKYITKNLTSQ